MKLSIIILNYKQRGHTRQLLRSISTLSLPYELEIIVVANGPEPGLADIVAEHTPNAHYIERERNDGYSVGNNTALRVVNGDMILILNPDISVFPGSIESMVDYLHAHPNVGLVGPKLINPDGSVQLSGARFPSFFIALWRRSAFGNWPGARQQIQKYFFHGWDRNSSRPVGWVLGAVLLMRREMIDNVGMFDEKFFLYVEDVDYCRRVWQAGWQVHYVADSEIVHFLSRQSAVNPGLSAVFSYTTRVHIQSWLYYFRKYYGYPRPELSM